MRLLIWQWGRRGAGPRFAAELAGALERLGHHPVLSLSQRAESFSGLSKLCGHGFHVDAGRNIAGQVRFGLGLPLCLSRLTKLLRDESIDGAVCSMPGYWDGSVAAVLQRTGVPLVSIIHDVRAHAGDSHHLVYRLQRRVMRNSKAIVTLSDHVADQLHREAPEIAGTQPIKRFDHPPFGFGDLNLNAPVAWKPRSGPLRILVVGRIKAYKGVETALAAMDELSDVSVQLRIAGAFGQTGWRARAEAMSTVTLRPDWLSERDLVAEIDDADLVLFPYVASTQSGLVPLCQSRGRVVLVTPVGGLVEQVANDHNGVVAAAATPKSIADSVRYLIDDPAFLARLANNARADRLPESGWSQLANGVVSVFDDL